MIRCELFDSIGSKWIVGIVNNRWTVMFDKREYQLDAAVASRRCPMQERVFLY